MATPQPLLVIVGQTGSGKSELALKLAKRFNGEIISADSWAIYRGLNIGTAKASSEERAAVRHHLIDFVEPDQDYTAADYKQDALKAIHDITKRGKLPILVGGTGLYIDSVIFDYSFLPVGREGQREFLNTQTLEELLSMAKNRQIDLEGIDIRNKRRVIRAIETGGKRSSHADLRPCTLLIGVRIDKSTLEERITKRVQAMLKSGLEEEVRQLAQTYGWDQEALKGIGYREWQPYFAGQQTLQQTRERIISATKNLAKRQSTWFKRNKSIQWVNSPQEVVDLVTTFLGR